ncbi:MAG: hypothetical protein ACKO40_08650 [Planctomycetaceae bacterium]
MSDATTTPWPDSGWFSTPSGRSVRLDPGAPLSGLDVTHAGHHDRLLALDLGATAAVAPVVERWCCGPDLTVVVEPDDARLLRSTMTWRYRPDAGGIDAWEAVISAQTSLLASDATVAVVSECAAADVVVAGVDGWRPTPGGPLPSMSTAALVRRPTTSVLVAVHPADLRQVDVSIRDSVARIGCVLFATAIEKGVLLRGRVLAAVGPRRLDEDWAGRLLAAFAVSPPPLST